MKKLIIGASPIVALLWILYCVTFGVKGGTTLLLVVLLVLSLVIWWVEFVNKHFDD